MGHRSHPDSGIFLAIELPGGLGWAFKAETNEQTEVAVRAKHHATFFQATTRDLNEWGGQAQDGFRHLRSSIAAHNRLRFTL